MNRIFCSHKHIIVVIFKIYYFFKVIELSINHFIFIHYIDKLQYIGLLIYSARPGFVLSAQMRMLRTVPKTAVEKDTASATLMRAFVITAASGLL